jgi:flagellar motor switch protein FliM
MMDPILTPSEMEALLQPSAAPARSRSVRPIDLIARDHQAFALLPQIQEAADQFAQQAGGRCTKMLRIRCKGAASPVEVVPGSRLADLFGNPRFVFGVTVNGQPGAGVLTVDARLGGALVANQFGGEIDDQPLLDGLPSRTEQRTVSRTVALFVEQLASALQQVSDLSLVLEPETTGLMKDPAKAQAVVMLALNLTLGEQEARMTLAFETAAAGFRVAARDEQPAVAEDAPLTEHLRLVPLEVVAELGRASLTVSDFLNLAVGDLIVLETPVDAEVPVRIEGQAKFVGRPEVSRGSLSVKISGPTKE